MVATREGMRALKSSEKGTFPFRMVVMCISRNYKRKEILGRGQYGLRYRVHVGMNSRTINWKHIVQPNYVLNGS